MLSLSKSAVKDFAEVDLTAGEIENITATLCQCRGLRKFLVATF